MPQDFNIPVLISAVFAANLTLAVIMVHARLTRRVYPGFNDWMVSQVVLAAGMVLLSLRGHVSPWISLLVGNSLLMLAQVFVYTGCIRFFDLPHHRRWPYYGLLGLGVAGFVWLILTGDSGSQRSLLFSLFMAAMMGRIIVALAVHRKIRNDPSVILFSAAAALAMLYFSARAVILWLVEPGNAEWNQRLLAGSFYVGIVFSMLLVFGFLQMVQARTEGELQLAQAKAEELAHTDRLTGAWNRRRFEQEAEREVARATRHKQPLSLIAFDIDDFKAINDRHGHQAGDEVLTGVCKLVVERVRSADALVRWGGDEFLVMTPATCANDAKVLAEELCAAVALSNFGPVGKVTLSVGVTEYRPTESLESWLGRADRGIYAAKARGRNQVAADFGERDKTPASGA